MFLSNNNRRKAGKEFGINLLYSREEGELLGTGGALKNARQFLKDEFFLIYGDSYLDIDYRPVYDCFLQSWDSPGEGSGGGVSGGNLIISSTICNNRASGGTNSYEGYTVPGSGSGISGSPQMMNCIIYSTEIAGGPIISYSDIEGGWVGVENIDDDPDFGGKDDYRLKSYSPCIDVGDNSVITWGLDLYGNPRIYDGQGGGIAIVDMGSYEYGHPCGIPTSTPTSPPTPTPTPTGPVLI